MILLLMPPRSTLNGLHIGGAEDLPMKTHILRLDVQFFRWK